MHSAHINLNQINAPKSLDQDKYSAAIAWQTFFTITLQPRRYDMFVYKVVFATASPTKEHMCEENGRPENACVLMCVCVGSAHIHEFIVILFGLSVLLRR